MEASEHFYSDDPCLGPSDVRTTLANTDYYFLGNGYISAAVQVCTSHEGTPLGLLLMSPEVFGPKRKALSLDPTTGLAATMVQAFVNDTLVATNPSSLHAAWEEREHVPVVRVEWGHDALHVCERFYCPDRAQPRLIRAITFTNRAAQTCSLRIQTGVRAHQINKSLTLAAGNEKICFIEYTLTPNNASVDLKWCDEVVISQEARDYWQHVADFSCEAPTLNHLFTASRHQLQATIAASGRSDASIWQYNLEWARDQAMLVLALTYSGQFERARTMLGRILTELVTDEGDAVDSSRKRPPQEVELDQNGVLLHAMRTYVDWTGDLAFARAHWPRLRAIADFPLKPVFRHSETFLLHNQREFWERHSLFGIADGMELAYQFYVSFGLEHAAYLARLLDETQVAQSWQEAAQKLKHAMLSHAKYALVDAGHLIKRRHVHGEVQTTIALREPEAFPPSIPLRQAEPHYLNPDSSAALPIALEFVDPRSALAQNTLTHLEGLWNQRWDIGGYSRYHVSSEPDSPGPWPFASLFIARAYFEAGNDDKVWRVLNWLMNVPGSKAGTWFEFYGPRPVPPCPQVGIIPWTWAEVLTFFIHHLLGIRPSWQHLHLRPRLLEGLQTMQATLRLREIRMQLHVQKVEEEKQTGIWIDGKRYPYTKEGLKLEWPQRDFVVEVKSF